MFESIRKRDGRIVPFEAEKITNAIAKAGEATGEFTRDVAQKLMIKVVNMAQTVIKEEIPSVEQIQDIVEEVLLDSPYRKTAKAYIIYREDHAKMREIVSKANSDLVDQYLNVLTGRLMKTATCHFLCRA
jgi:ribonucleoside-triphosphate reductase